IVDPPGAAEGPASAAFSGPLPRTSSPTGLIQPVVVREGGLQNVRRSRSPDGTGVSAGDRPPLGCGLRPTVVSAAPSEDAKPAPWCGRVATGDLCVGRRAVSWTPPASAFGDGSVMAVVAR